MDYRYEFDLTIVVKKDLPEERRGVLLAMADEVADALMNEASVRWNYGYDGKEVFGRESNRYFQIPERVLSSISGPGEDFFESIFVSCRLGSDWKYYDRILLRRIEKKFGISLRKTKGVYFSFSGHTYDWDYRYKDDPYEEPRGDYGFFSYGMEPWSREDEDKWLKFKKKFWRFANERQKKEILKARLTRLRGEGKIFIKWPAEDCRPTKERTFSFGIVREGKYIFFD